MSRCGEMLRIRHLLLRQALAECLGTLILVVSGGTRRSPSLSRPPRSAAPLFTLEGLFFKAGAPPLPALLPTLTHSRVVFPLAPIPDSPDSCQRAALTPLTALMGPPLTRAAAHRRGAVVTPAV